MSSDERKQAIVKAAVKLFSEKGFAGTTTRELAAAVGVSEPVLYQHFQTKRDLYTAIIDTKSQEGEAKFSQILGPHLNLQDDQGFFTGLAELIVDWHADDPGYIRLLLYSGLERHELAEISYQRQKKVFLNLIAKYLQSRIEEGALRQVDAMTAAHSFVGMVAHYALGAVLFGCVDLEATRHQVIPAMVNIFLNGMRSSHE